MARCPIGTDRKKNLIRYYRTRRMARCPIGTDRNLFLIRYYRTRRMARCPIGTDRRISPGRWVSTRACASCSCMCKCEPVLTCHPQYVEQDVEDVECGAAGSGPERYAS
eukprot:469398-Prymnesium_polylepis.1